VSIGKKAVRGVLWNMSTGVGARIVQLVGTLILTRFIAPAEYGEVFTAAICVTTAGMLTTFCFGQYLIARRAPADVAFQAAELHIGMGVVALLVVYLLRHPLGAMVDAPAMAQFIPGFALSHLIDRVRYTPEKILIRDLRFRTVAIGNGLGELTYTATALALAPHFGGAAIVAGWVVRSLLLATIFLAAAPRNEWLVPSPIRGDVVRALMGYGAPLMITSLADMASSRWDNLIVSRLFGPSVMGGYNLAYSLAETPISYVAEHIGDVLMPSYARMEPAQRRAAMVRAAGLMGLVVSPLGVGLGAVAATLVHTFFDARWAPMAPMLAVLSIMSVFRPITWSASAFLQAQHRTRLLMIMSFFRAVILLGLVALLGSLGGPLWACAAVGIAYTIHAIIMIVITGRAEGISATAYLVGTARPLIACVPMFLAVTGVQLVLERAGVPGVVSLIAQVLTGAVVYVGAAFVFARALANDLLALGKGVVRRIK
jgi:PST family polysaccharide transporter